MLGSQDRGQGEGTRRYQAGERDDVRQPRRVCPRAASHDADDLRDRLASNLTDPLLPASGAYRPEALVDSASDTST